MQMLSPRERQRVKEVELRHGVMINVSADGTYTAKRFREGSDVVVADADSLAELEVVLQASFVFPDDEE